MAETSTRPAAGRAVRRRRADTDESIRRAARRIDRGLWRVAAVGALGVVLLAALLVYAGTRVEGLGRRHDAIGARLQELAGLAVAVGDYTRAASRALESDAGAAAAGARLIERRVEAGLAELAALYREDRQEGRVAGAGWYEAPPASDPAAAAAAAGTPVAGADDAPPEVERLRKLFDALRARVALTLEQPRPEPGTGAAASWRAVADLALDTRLTAALQTEIAGQRGEATDLRAEAAGLRLWLIAGGLITAVLTIVLSVLPALRLGRRARAGGAALAEGLHAVARGRLDHAVTRPTGDEFGPLAKRFNAMTKGLRRRRLRWRDTRAELAAARARAEANAAVASAALADLGGLAEERFRAIRDALPPGDRLADLADRAAAQAFAARTPGRRPVEGPRPREKADLTALLDKTGDDLKALARRRGMRIEIGKAPEPVTIARGDALWLRHAVLLLAGGMARLVPRGGRLLVEPRGAGGEADLAFVYLGLDPGAPSSTPEEATEADARRAAAGEADILLARWIVERHDGRLDVTADGDGRGAIVARFAAAPTPS